MFEINDIIRFKGYIYFFDNSIVTVFKFAIPGAKSSSDTVMLAPIYRTWHTHFNRNSYIFIQENQFDNDVWKW